MSKKKLVSILLSVILSVLAAVLGCYFGIDVDLSSIDVSDTSICSD